MNNKIVCITGASKGIGAATARRFAKDGYNIILHYNNSKKLAEDLKKNLENKYHINVYLLQCDLSKEDEIEKFILKINEITNNLDVLINNASLSLDCDIFTKTKQEFINVLDVNLIAPFLLIKGLSNLLNEGVIINISSTDGINTGSIYNIDYSCSKAGLNILTDIMSQAYPNIKIYSLAPNWVETESVLEMDPEYLESELTRIKQDKLISKNEVADKIIEIVNDKKLRSGNIIRMDGSHE